MTAQLRYDLVEVLDVALVTSDVQFVIDDLSHVEVNFVMQIFDVCLHR